MTRNGLKYILEIKNAQQVDILNSEKNGSIKPLQTHQAINFCFVYKIKL